MIIFKKDQNGAALIIVLVLTMLAAFVSMAIMRQVSNTVKTSSNNRINVTLLNIAEAGKEHAMSLLQSGQVVPNPGQTLVIAENQNFGGGRYIVQGSSSSDGSTLVMTSTASMANKSKSIEVTCAVDTGIKFQITDGTVTPSEVYSASVNCLGAGFQLSYNGSYYNAPIAVRLTVGGTTIDPWGSFTSRTLGNINDASNPREYVLPDQYPAGTPISVKANVWKRTGTSTWQVFNTIGSSPATPYVKVLRNGDAVPSVSGFLNQASISSYVSNYVKNGKISLEANQSILLFELYTSLTGSTADFQDLVVLVTLAKPGSSSTQISTTQTSTPQKTYRVTSWKEI